jgi:hypothetical protein
VSHVAPTELEDRNQLDSINILRLRRSATRYSPAEPCSAAPSSHLLPLHRADHTAAGRMRIRRQRTTIPAPSNAPIVFGIRSRERQCPLPLIPCPISTSAPITITARNHRGFIDAVLWLTTAIIFHKARRCAWTNGRASAKNQPGRNRANRNQLRSPPNSQWL